MVIVELVRPEGGRHPDDALHLRVVDEASLGPLRAALRFRPFAERGIESGPHGFRGRIVAELGREGQQIGESIQRLAAEVAVSRKLRARRDILTELLAKLILLRLAECGQIECVRRCDGGGRPGQARAGTQCHGPVHRGVAAQRAARSLQGFLLMWHRRDERVFPPGRPVAQFGRYLLAGGRVGK